MSTILNQAGTRATLPVLTTTVKSLFSTRCYSPRQPDPTLTNIQLQERYREFNIAELQRVAVEASSAGPRVRMEKLGEGTYNKTFKLTMANDKILVARIPNPNVGPDFLTTASEIATMEFMSCSTSSLSRLLTPSSAQKSGPTNSVGSDYIVMEHASGTYGCLYFAENAPPGSHPAMLSGDDLSHAFQRTVADKFSIGPVVNATFWNKERVHMNIDRGPWASALGFIQAPALREISWLEKYADPNPVEELVMPSHNFYPPTEHISVIQRYLPLKPHLLPSEEDIAGAFLYHADMSSANIFVDDDDKITSIINWQSSATCPLFVGVFELPEDFDTLDEQKQKSIKYQRDNSKMLYIYNDYTKERNPFLHKVYSYMGGRLLVHKYENSLFLQATLLTSIQNSSTGRECPLSSLPEEISNHFEDGEGWHEIQYFLDSIEHILDRDGWTSNEPYENAKSIYDDKEFQDVQ
ncbi:hypothetical protein BDV19DRAFT_377848 [Aspergillus venezuelensis]